MTHLPELSLPPLLALLPAGAQGVEARALVRRAYEFALRAHAGQERKSGGPFIQHPLHVAYSLAELHFEPVAIAAGLLHDVLEDNPAVTRSQLLEEFGPEVLILVEGVTKLESVEERVKQEGISERDLQELESLRKMFIAMAKDDERIIFIKLADRLHNMRTLEGLEPEDRDRMARETLDIFAPLANRLGIWLWKAELEDLSFRQLHEQRYQEIAEFLATRKEERQARVRQHVAMLRQALAEEGIPGKIKGRPKHIYSIYRKMQRKNVPFKEIYDTEGHRIVVDSARDCYRVLGIVHRLWTPIPGEFDDYIANPKPNGYQSLHTAVMAEGGDSLEIQIRTYEMDYLAEHGVAAHWLYKEQGVKVSEQMLQHLSTLRQSVQEASQDEEDPQELIDTVRTDVFGDRVFVFTPKGKVIDLPRGATPIDFAYHIHTEVGHRCRGARVNNQWMPLNYELQTGQQVEIILGRRGGPSRDWINEELGFTRTNRARQKIKQWFRQQSREENADQGRTMVEREIKRLGLKVSAEEVAGFFSKRFQHPDDFFAAVGVGDVTSERIAHRIEDVLRRRREEAEEDELVLPEEEKQVEKAPPRSPPVEIQGTGNYLTRLAGCCRPLPGESVIGYVTRGRGVSIHRSDCATILRLMREEPERVIELDWGKQKETFPAEVIVTAYHRSRLLHDISTVLANEDVDLLSVKTGKRDRYNIVPIHVTVEVPDLIKLNRVLGKIEQLPNVIETRRQA